MNVAILLPGYLDSPDYVHFQTFENRLTDLGYKVIRLDPCDLWSTGDITTYTISHYLNNVKKQIEMEVSQGADEIVLLGHSLGGFVSIIAGSHHESVSQIIALCPPASYKDAMKKWKGSDIRSSKRYLPSNSEEYRVFNVPISFAIDAQQYSAVEVINTINKPLMIFIGLEDTVIPPEVTEQLVAVAKNPYVVRKEGIGHDFRNSEEESNIVMDEVEKFLQNDELEIEIKASHKDDLDFLHNEFSPHNLMKYHHQRYELQEKGEGIYLIAWTNKKPVGHFLLRWNGPDKDTSGNYPYPTPYLEAGGTKSAYRRKGIATKMIQKAESLVREKGGEKIGLAVGSTSNPVARKLYEKLGYKDWGRGEFSISWKHINPNGGEETHSEVCIYMFKNL